MRNLILFVLCFTIYNMLVFSQNIQVSSVSPDQDIIGAERNVNIIVKINKPVDSTFYNSTKLFRVYGSNSGLVKGKTEVNTSANEFVFTPTKPLFCGEVIEASFGPIWNANKDTLRSFNWRFTVEITNPTNAQFDSLKRFSYPSYYSTAVDYDKDDNIDIVSGSGLVIYNDGFGNFSNYHEIEELSYMKYFVDVNNDGIEDIISSGPGEAAVFVRDSNRILYNKQQVLYPYNQVGGSIIAQGDINGDGYIDLISSELYTEYDNCWRVFINDGTGKFIRDANTVYLKNRISFNAKLIDMNKDGNLDLVLLNNYAANYQQGDSLGVYVYLNNGNGKFSNYFYAPFRLSSMPIGQYGLIQQLYIIDYDKNGLNDIAGLGSEEGGLVLMQNTAGNFMGYDSTYFCGGENGADFTSGDVNGDNRIDLVTSGTQVCLECANGEVTMQITINNTKFNFFKDNLTFSLGLRNEVGDGTVPIMADVDDDGDLDIINTGYPTNIYYNRNKAVDVKKREVIPTEFSVSQNYPNPFNPTTTIQYTIQALTPSLSPRERVSVGQVRVTLVVYDIIGRVVSTLVNEEKLPGNYEVKFDASKLATGVYIYRITANNFVQAKKMLFIK